MDFISFSFSLTSIFNEITTLFLINLQNLNLIPVEIIPIEIKGILISIIQYYYLIPSIVTLPIDLKIVCAMMMLSLVTFIGYLLSPQIPDLNSGLNRRQKFSVTTIMLLSACFIYLFYYFTPHWFRIVLISYLILVEIISIVFWLYDPIVYGLSLIKERYFSSKEEMIESDHKNTFAIVISAHNEERVIGNLLDSINQVDYDKEFYDVYVICDNCTDDTEGVVDTYDVIKRVRHNKIQIGKGYALEWLFSQIETDPETKDKYDGYIIIDADNLINEPFLQNINNRMNNGQEVIQAYLGCKNPDDTWVSRSYSLSYWLTNDIFQNAHEIMGLSAQLGGTGMIFKPEALQRIGFVETLTEDLAFTSIYVLKYNELVHWEENSQIYDEKPLQIGNSIRQRTRWMQGHMDACYNYFFPLIKQSIKNLSFKQLDVAFYLVKPLLSMIIFIGYVTLLGLRFILPEIFKGVPFIVSWEFVIGLLIAYFIFYSIILIKVERYKYILATPLVMIYSITNYIAVFKGIVKRKEQYWVKTEHGRSMDLEEVEEEQNETIS